MTQFGAEHRSCDIYSSALTGGLKWRAKSTALRMRQPSPGLAKPPSTESNSGLTWMRSSKALLLRAALEVRHSSNTLLSERSTATRLTFGSEALASRCSEETPLTTQRATRSF